LLLRVSAWTLTPGGAGQVHPRIKDQTRRGKAQNAAWKVPDATPNNLILHRFFKKCRGLGCSGCSSARSFSGAALSNFPSISISTIAVPLRARWAQNARRLAGVRQTEIDMN
jgi:hypothetical protein